MGSRASLTKLGRGAVFLFRVTQSSDVGLLVAGVGGFWRVSSLSLFLRRLVCFKQGTLRPFLHSQGAARSLLFSLPSSVFVLLLSGARRVRSKRSLCFACCVCACLLDCLRLCAFARTQRTSKQRKTAERSRRAREGAGLRAALAVRVCVLNKKAVRAVAVSLVSRAIGTVRCQPRCSVHRGLVLLLASAGFGVSFVVSVCCREAVASSLFIRPSVSP